MLVSIVAAPAAGGEGFSSQPPAVRDISPVMDGDPYYECAGYGYQLSKGACAPGWPHPAEGWSGGAPREEGGREASWAPEQSYPPSYPGRTFGAPAAPAAPAGLPNEPSPWRAEAAYPWGPDYMDWGRARMLDGPRVPWEQAAPGWGRAGQAAENLHDMYPPGPAPRGRGPDAIDYGGPGDPMRRRTSNWDPWLQDSPADTATGPQNPRPVPETGPQTQAEPASESGGWEPMGNAPADPGAPSGGQVGEDTAGDAVPGPAGPWDPPR